MSETRAALDHLVATALSLITRLMRTESLAVIGVGAIALVGDLEAEGIISSAAAGVALVIGRSIVKARS
jgi:hypothetical protein